MLAIDDVLGDAAELAEDDQKIRWFNHGMHRLGYLRRDTRPVTWASGDDFVAFSTPTLVHSVQEIRYPAGALETRWRPVVGGLEIPDYDGACDAGSALVIVRAFWPEVTDADDSLLPPVGDQACISYACSRFYRRLVGSRALFQRYATLMGQNGVSIDDLGQVAEDHARDFLELRSDLSDEPAATFYGA